ncbi:MAG: hypothetical protein ACK4VI_06565 [Alphaproteobacteria bacterium]
MKITLEFLEARLRQMGSRCEPLTSPSDRKGFKPQKDILDKTGLRLSAVFSKEGFVEFQIVEKGHQPDKIFIRDFPYDAHELVKIEQELLTTLSTGKRGYATEWNWLQVSRALLLLESDDPSTSQMALMRDNAARVPIIMAHHDDV